MWSPPGRVKGMKEWDPEAFKKVVALPCVEMPAENVGAFNKLFKKYLAKRPKFRGVRPSDSGPGKLKVLLNPEVASGPDAFGPEEHTRMEKLTGAAPAEALKIENFSLDSDNWTPTELLDAVLLDEENKVPSLSSYSMVGHVIHVNLKDHHLPQKRVIGEILLKLPQARTVVNKTANIDNTFRNFSLEVLAGESDFEVTTKENGCQFRFDFSRVYWNPRLVTEHGRVLDLLQPGDEVFDVFAGVGPFAVPAAKAKRIVYANDLNPESFRWLNENAKSNKAVLHSYNLDGREFIKSVLPSRMLEDSEGRIHVLMNLPALAVEFLDAFKGIIRSEDLSGRDLPRLPIVHVYSFLSETDTTAAEEELRNRCEAALECKLGNVDAFLVRDVAPKKFMFRATFELPKDVVLETSSSDESPQPKRIKVVEN